MTDYKCPRASRLRRAATDICNRFCATRPCGTACSGHDKPPDGPPDALPCAPLPGFATVLRPVLAVIASTSSARATETFPEEVKGGISAKKSKYAGRAGMARRHPGPVDKGRLLRPTCAKNEGFVIRAADLETGFYTMKSPMRPEETTFHTRVCEIEGRGGHCRPDRRRRLRETPSAWPPFPSRSRQRKTRDRNAPAPINPFYMRVIPLGHLRCLISL